VLLYHRFEDRPAGLATTPNDFRAQMKALKDNGISVISMQDLLAWRNGKKAIPSKSAVITIDESSTIRGLVPCTGAYLARFQTR
jgi:hypothetical protein